MMQKKWQLTGLVMLSSVLLFSCAASKTYFTPQVRNKIERAGVSLNKLQFFIDRDVLLKREITKEEAQVAKGNIQIENGKYIDLIRLHRNTPGICTGTFPDKVLVSFEQGDNKFLTFGKTKYATGTDPYRILAFDWLKDGEGTIRYEGKTYHIVNGTDAGIQIKSKFLRKADEVKERNMNGVKVSE
ncbi:MAG: hypothetical protein KGO81_05290 [Bacteroidota bacterium]|nr:hypothetical protein [Bacteroidota bacterium]